jgi:hypothetical protein
MSEQRRHRRISVEMWVEERHDGVTYFQRATNLSLGGVWLEGTIPHPRGTRIELSFTLPGDAQPIVTAGEVVGEVDEAHLGMHVRFLDVGVTGPVRARLESFLATKPETP